MDASRLHDLTASLRPLTAWYLDAELLPDDKPGYKPISVQGVPMQWSFVRGDKLLALVSYATLRGSEYFDHAIVEFDVASVVGGTRL